MRTTLGDLSSDFSKRDLAYLVFKRKHQVAVVFLTTATLVVTGAWMRPPVYEATATLYIVRNLPPIAATSPSTFNIILDRREVLNSEVDLITSRPVAEEAADVVMARPSPPPGPPPRAVAPSTYAQVIAFVRGGIGRLTRAAGLEERPLARREALINQLQRVRAVPALNSDFLAVSFESEDPEYAAFVVNTVTEIYLRQRLRLFKRPGLQDFYDEQVARSASSVEELSRQVAELKAATGVVAPAEQLKLKLDQLSSLYDALGDVRTEIQEGRERIATLRARVDAEPASIVASRTTERNPMALDLERRRAALAAERATELNRFQPGSAPILEIDRNLERIQEAIAAEPETLVHSESTAQNMVRATLTTELYRAEADLTAKVARERTLLAQIDASVPEVARMDTDATELNRLNEALDSANRIHARYLEQREEGRIATATDPGMTNAQLVSAASVPARPLYARRLLIPAGLALGLFVGCLVAFISAIFTQTLDRREDAERALGLPVLASLPTLKALRVQAR